MHVHPWPQAALGVHLAALGLLFAVEVSQVTIIILDVMWDTWFYLIMKIFNVIRMMIINEQPSATSC